MEAIIDGAVAGAVGSHAIGLFFAATQRIAPNEEVDFAPPEPVQKIEQPTETVARRVVEGLARAEPMAPETKRIAGEIVRYGFGAAWGALYGAAAESFPMLASPVGAALFGTKVWAISHLLLMPMFNLEPPPTRYTMAHHVYGIAAHAVFGLSVLATYRALSSPLIRPLLITSAAALYLLRMRPMEREPVIIEEPVESYLFDPAIQPVL